MARNKHPEETVNLILDVAFRLFMEKGYEHTSIQDIIKHLGGLSKGAIYHHFKSKEDILEAVSDRMAAESNKMLADIRDDMALNGLEKLRKIFKKSICRPVQDEIFTVAPDFHSNPKLPQHAPRAGLPEAPLFLGGIGDLAILRIQKEPFTQHGGSLHLVDPPQAGTDLHAPGNSARFFSPQPQCVPRAAARYGRGH